MILDFLGVLDEFYWEYVGWIIIIFSGVYFTFISRCFQFRQILNIKKNLLTIVKNSDKKTLGINPFKIFFASVGGMVGLGNITGISFAVMIGGVGSIFWTLIASLFGSLIKYSEIYIGIKYRVQNSENSFDGGPMFFLQKAFNKKYLSYIFCVIMCIYGVEIYQFQILVKTIESTFHLEKIIAILILLLCVLWSVQGGIKRLANIATVLMPLFMVLYVCSSIYILIVNSDKLCALLVNIIKSAFLGSAPLGGFAGSSVILSCYLGVSKAIYSGDICVGYDSVIQSETKVVNPKYQGILAIYGLFSDNFICILTNLVIGITGGWYKLNHLDSSEIIPTIFEEYFGNYSNILIPILFFFAGITTITSVLIAATKAAKFIFPKNGKIIYTIYACLVLVFFSYYSEKTAIIILSLLSGLLVLMNLLAIIKLRKEVKF